jgi:hypothetical protein
MRILELGVFDPFVPVFSGKRAGLAGIRKGRFADCRSANNQAVETSGETERRTRRVDRRVGQCKRMGIPTSVTLSLCLFAECEEDIV